MATLCMYPGEAKRSNELLPPEQSVVLNVRVEIIKTLGLAGQAETLIGHLYNLIQP